MVTLKISTVLALAVFASRALAGPFPPAAGQPGSDAVAGNDVLFTLWAATAEITRGPTNIASANPVAVGFGEAEDATGPADATPDEPYTVVSLGDGGSATLTFAAPFGDVPGPDFAVFENGFSAGFLELAHVEISSDGVNFFRFPSTSLTPSSANIGEGGSVDPTNVRNLAGKYLAGFGTPFDLSELRGVSPDLDIQRITHVRVIDAVGTNNPAYASLDSAGAIVIDPYPTNYFTGGFDLDAVGAFSQTATTYAAWKSTQGISDPDPAADANHDGVPNLIEYLTGDGVLEITIGPRGRSNLGLNRLSYRTGGNLRVEFSSDLIHWDLLAESINGAPFVPAAGQFGVVETGDALKHVSLAIANGESPAYYRLAAELVPTP